MWRTIPVVIVCLLLPRSGPVSHWIKRFVMTLFQVPHLPLDQPMPRRLFLQKPYFVDPKGFRRTVGMRNRGNITLTYAKDPILVYPKGVERPGLNSPFGDVIVSLFALPDFVWAVFGFGAWRYSDGIFGK